jgi:hypothetical protein
VCTKDIYRSVHRIGEYVPVHSMYVLDCPLFEIYSMHMLFSLLYKPEVRGFDYRWCHWNFSLTQSFRSHYSPGVDSASNRNEYQEYFLGGKGGRCVGLTT